jgi:hypothetical protein
MFLKEFPYLAANDFRELFQDANRAIFKPSFNATYVSSRYP